MILGVFDHVTIRVSDLAASRAFYELLLGAPTHVTGDFTEWDDFGIAPGAPTRGLHVGFVAASPAEVDATWRRVIDAGYESDGAPGPRPQYGPEYYGGSLLDPDRTAPRPSTPGRRTSPTGASTTCGSASPTSRRRSAS